MALSFNGLATIHFSHKGLGVVKTQDASSSSEPDLSVRDNFLGDINCIPMRSQLARFNLRKEKLVRPLVPPNLLKNWSSATQHHGSPDMQFDNRQSGYQSQFLGCFALHDTPPDAENAIMR
jgi:hypothetical protein